MYICINRIKFFFGRLLREPVCHGREWWRAAIAQPQDAARRQVRQGGGGDRRRGAGRAVRF